MEPHQGIVEEIDRRREAPRDFEDGPRRQVVHEGEALVRLPTAPDRGRGARPAGLIRRVGGVALGAQGGGSGRPERTHSLRWWTPGFLPRLNAAPNATDSATTEGCLVPERRKCQCTHLVRFEVDPKGLRQRPKCQSGIASCRSARYPNVRKTGCRRITLRRKSLNLDHGGRGEIRERALGD